MRRPRGLRRRPHGRRHRSAAGAGVSTSGNRAALTAQVREELLHAWRGYERYAWVLTELKPVSRTARDWYGEPLLMTPVDALDTLILLGLKDEASRPNALILDDTSRSTRTSRSRTSRSRFDSSAASSPPTSYGRPRLLALADDLGRRLLPALRLGDRDAVREREPEDRQDVRRRVATRRRSARCSSNSARCRS